MGLSASLSRLVTLTCLALFCATALVPQAQAGPGKGKALGKRDKQEQSNSVPSISGVPAESVAEGSTYVFQPSASDADGDSLTFSIQNRPSWASFNGSTGRLYGTPDAADVGNYDNIKIAVSDGAATTSLPAFSIAVNAVTAAASHDLFLSSFPDRSGATPLNGSSVTGDVYVFAGPDSSIQKAEFFIDDTSAQGIAYQTEGNAPYDLAGTLSADVAKPFDTTQLTQGLHTVTARLTLMDGSNQLVNAVVWVTNDGDLIAQTGSVSLSWVAPTQRADGTPISVSELAGYTVHYGPSQGNYTSSIAIDDPFTTSVVVTDLPTGTYYFALTAIDKAGLESGYSGAVSKQTR